ASKPANERLVAWVTWPIATRPPYIFVLVGAAADVVKGHVVRSRPKIKAHIDVDIELPRHLEDAIDLERGQDAGRSQPHFPSAARCHPGADTLGLPPKALGQPSGQRAESSSLRLVIPPEVRRDCRASSEPARATVHLASERAASP